jgi:cellulose synthase/poly-beta-1,6-N-acetylglucosamine synthase-like glycosyltransferase
MRRRGTPLVAAGTTLALAGTAHALVNARLLPRPTPLPGPVDRQVSILVPARDEGANLVAGLPGLLDQGAREVLVLDDGSTDGTAVIARAAMHGRARARLITGAALPDGWLGKPHACAQLARAADPASEVLVLVDADVRLEPGAVAAAVDLLDRLGVDVLSPHPRQLAVTAAERLVQPLLQWSWLTFVPLRVARRSARPSLAVANGQFLVVRRAAYERAGGHGAIRAEVLDDLALARAVIRSGGRVAVVDGSRIATCRMYAGWIDVRDGYGKSLWSAFGSPAGAAAVVGLLGVAYVVPAVAALRGSRLGLLGYLAGVAGRVIAARATGGRSWPDAAAHPASIIGFGYLTARSLRQRRAGALSWKGRPI